MSDDMTWMRDPPRYEDPEEAAEANRILKRPVNEPYGHEPAHDVQPAHREKISPTPTKLSPDYDWFFPGLAYCMLGLDRSIFALYSQFLNQDVKVTSYRVSQPIAHFDGADITSNTWFHTIQGVEEGIGAGVAGYVGTFRFHDPFRQKDWGVRAEVIRIADPCCPADKVGATVTVLLPVCISDNWHTRISQYPGLRLDDLHIGIHREA